MKKAIIGIGCIIFSLILTFVIFETLSWCHFGDIPTKIVALRLCTVFFFLSIATNVIAYKIQKKRGKE